MGFRARQQTGEAIARLKALHEAGHQYVLISAVLGWLGETVDDKPPPSPDAGTGDGGDPLARLGIKPVTPPQE